MIEQLLLLDRQCFIFLNTFFSNMYLDAFFLTITDPHSWIIPSIALATTFIFKERRKAIIILILAIITVSATDMISARLLKPLFGRLRPCNPDILLEGCNFLSGRKRSFSFPSSHATNMFGQAFLLTYFYPKRILLFMGFASLIGFSRIYVGVHYPGDILGGLFFGAIIAAIVVYVYSTIKKRFIKKPVITTDKNLAISVNK